MADLTNASRTDREMLVICYNVRDRKTDIIRSVDVAEKLQVDAKNGRSPAGRVSSRLSWMARYELLERLDSRAWGFKSTEAIWAITNFGHDVRQGNVSKALLKQIVSATAGERVLITRELAQVGLRGRERNVLRRQWQHDLVNSK